MILRWKPHIHQIFGLTQLALDADGCQRIFAEGMSLAVAYPKQPEHAYVEGSLKASVQRTFTVAKGRTRTPLLVVKIEVHSSVGNLVWTADPRPDVWDPMPKLNSLLIQLVPATFPLQCILHGTLTLPDGSHHLTGTGKGFFEADGLVHAYTPWQDRDVAEGWSVITEVESDCPDGLQTILSALPLLFFTSPPLA